MGAELPVPNDVHGIIGVAPKGLFGAGNAAPRRNVRMHSPGRGNEVPRGDVPCLRTHLGPKKKYILFVSCIHHVR